MRFTIRDLMWLTVVVAAFCTGTQLDRYLEHYRADPHEASIRAELNKTTYVDVVEMPLKDVVLYLQETHNIPIILSLRKLEEASISPDTPVTKSLRGITLRSALKLLLNDLDLAYVVENGVLTITTKEDAGSTPFSLRTAMWLSLAAVVLLGIILFDRAWCRRAGHLEPLDKNSN
ncbi:MAG TPA: hypothetical protein VGI40_06255 [Pirellulaceae bacterium]|jgi:hypothetical protein